MYVFNWDALKHHFTKKFNDYVSNQYHLLYTSQPVFDIEKYQDLSGQTKLSGANFIGLNFLECYFLTQKTWWKIMMFLCFLLKSMQTLVWTPLKEHFCCVITFKPSFLQKLMQNEFVKPKLRILPSKRSFFLFFMLTMQYVSMEVFLLTWKTTEECTTSNIGNVFINVFYTYKRGHQETLKLSCKRY